MTDQDEIERGFKAIQLLENPIFQEAYSKIYEAIISEWENAPIRDKEGQHELKLMLKLLKDLKANIKTIADTGKMKKLQIEKKGLFNW